MNALSGARFTRLRPGSTPAGNALGQPQIGPPVRLVGRTWDSDTTRQPDGEQAALLSIRQQCPICPSVGVLRVKPAYARPMANR